MEEGGGHEDDSEIYFQSSFSLKGINFLHPCAKEHLPQGVFFWGGRGLFPYILLI